MCLDICHHIYASISCLTSGFVFYAKTVKKTHGLRIAISTLSMHKSKSISTYRNIENMLLSDLTYNIRGEHKHDRISGIFATSNFLFWNIRSNGGQCACAFKKYRVFRLGCNYLPKQSFWKAILFFSKDKLYVTKYSNVKTTILILTKKYRWKYFTVEKFIKRKDKTK